MTFLGHRIGSEGIGTAEDKVRAVREWPVPANQRELKSFLVLASYYRKFVRGFSCIAAPLYKLLQKDQCFVWSEGCQNAFDTLKQILVCAPILAPPDPQPAFVLDTDTSGDGIGAVLSQVWPITARCSAKRKRGTVSRDRSCWPQSVPLGISCTICAVGISPYALTMPPCSS